MFGRLGESIAPSVAAGVLAAALAVALLILGARWWMRPVEGPIAEGGWTRRSRAAFAPSGFFPAEGDSSGGYFSWSREHAEIQFTALDRSRAHRVTVRVRGGRPPSAAPAQLRLTVDGQARWAEAAPDEPSTIEFEIPRAPRTGAVIGLDVSPTYTPGGRDPRALGIIVDDLAIAPVSGPFVPAGAVLWRLAGAVFAAVLGLQLCGLRGRAGVVAAGGVAVGCAWLLWQDAAFMGDFAQRLVHLGAAILLAGTLVAMLRLRWPSLAGVPEWSVAVGLILAVSFVKLGIFWHPLAIVGDGIFQVHRAQVVHGGEFFFTSVTPKPFFEFPYPVALYIFALPFWNWFPTELDLLRLLRTVTVAADVLTGLMLYGAVRRQWNNRTAALCCAVLWPLSRAPFEALSNANLTNLFGQSVFGAALAGIAWLAAGTRVSPVALVLAGVLLAIAFLSHFGTLTVGIAILGGVVLSLVAVGRGHPRRIGICVLATMLAVLAVSWTVYYSRFTDVYRRSWVAASAEERDNSSKIVAPPSVKLARWWSGTGDDYGRPGVVVLLVALAGAALLIRERTTGAGVVFLAWLVAWIALSALGVLTPFTLRANLAAAPAFVALSAIALGTLAGRTWVGQVGAVALSVAVAWDGWRVAVMCLQLTTHN